mgnify:CR=1 FL=1
MQLELSRHVGADPDTVWPGPRGREPRTMFGMKATEEMRVLAAAPPHSTTIVAENGGTEYRTVFTVTPDADGPGSTLRMHFGAETAHAPAISRVVMALMGGVAERSTRKTMERDLADIAAEAERRASA